MGCRVSTLRDGVMQVNGITLSEEECIDFMREGCRMVKMNVLAKKRKKYKKYVSLDEDLLSIRYYPSKKTGFKYGYRIPVDSIISCKHGEDIPVTHMLLGFPLNCQFVITYNNEENERAELAFAAFSQSSANKWIVGFNAVQRRQGSLHSRRDPLYQPWLRDAFEQVDVDKNGALCIEEIDRLLNLLNFGVEESLLNSTFVDVNVDGRRDLDGKLNREEVADFFRILGARKEISSLIKTKNDSGFLDAEDLHSFMLEQGESVTLDDCSNLIEEFNVDHECDPSRLGQEGLARLLLSGHGDIFNSVHKTVYQDMSQPLAHYFIDSSHNTYLMAGQFRGPSSIQAYVNALLQGCRCVELDVWDGDGGEPVIYHGHTLTSKILAKDALRAIAEHAFAVSDYPVILSFENHCSVEQQKRLASHLKLIFGDLLFMDPVNEELDCLPSPDSLKRRLLVKGRKLSDDDLPSPTVRGPFYVADAPVEINTVQDDVGYVSSEDEGEATLGAVLEDEIMKRRLEEEVMDDGYEDDDPQRRELARRLLYCGDQDRLTAVTPSPFDNKSGSSADDVENGPAIRESPSTSELESGVGMALARSRSESCANDFESGPGYAFRRSVNRSWKLSETLVAAVKERKDDLEGRPERRRRKKKKDQKLARDLSRLVNYMQSVTFVSFEAAANNRFYMMSSIGETKALGLARRYGADFVEHNKRLMTRIYPSGSRLDSSNYNPCLFWNVGCQIVALNYQTSDVMMELLRGRFEDNGRCGYVLKPKFLREASVKFDPNEPNVDDSSKKSVSIKIISGQLLPKRNVDNRMSVGLPKRKADNRIVDPHVMVEVFGVAEDCLEKPFCTNVVRSNGFNPIWDKEFQFTLSVPELALLRFSVHDADTLLAQYTLPFCSMRTGYRHMHLKSESRERLPYSTLFVHVSVCDVNPPSGQDAEPSTPLQQSKLVQAVANSRLTSSQGTPTGSRTKHKEGTLV